MLLNQILDLPDSPSFLPFSFRSTWCSGHGVASPGVLSKAYKPKGKLELLKPTYNASQDCAVGLGNSRQQWKLTKTQQNKKLILSKTEAFMSKFIQGTRTGGEWSFRMATRSSSHQYSDLHLQSPVTCISMKTNKCSRESNPSKILKCITFQFQKQNPTSLLSHMALKPLLKYKSTSIIERYSFNII